MVRPDPAEPQEELRLLIALLPMHIRLDQLVCHFLAVFFAPPETTVLVAVSGVDGGEDEDSGTTGVSPGEWSALNPVFPFTTSRKLDTVC